MAGIGKQTKFYGCLLKNRMREKNREQSCFLEFLKKEEYVSSYSLMFYIAF